MADVRSLKVFLCHASIDKPKVKKYYERLIADKVDAWLDAENLIPGQLWDNEIQAAIRSSHVFIVFLTKNSVSKEGYIQKEIKTALDCAEEKLEESIYIIPALLEECGVPVRLSKYQYADLSNQDGYVKLLRSLQLRAQQIGLDTSTQNELEKSPLEDGILAPEGATLRYRDKNTAFIYLGKFIEDIIASKRKESDWLSAIEIQNISISGVYSKIFFMDMLSKFLQDYPILLFKIQYLLIDPKYLNSLPLSITALDWSNSSKSTLLDLMSFIETSQSKWNKRLEFSVKTIEGLPEKSGTLLNREHLFFSEMDFSDNGENKPQMLVNQNAYYCSVNDVMGQKEVSLFQNRFKFYWNFLSVRIN